MDPTELWSFIVSRSFLSLNLTTHQLHVIIIHLHSTIVAIAFFYDQNPTPKIIKDLLYLKKTLKETVTSLQAVAFQRS